MREISTVAAFLSVWLALPPAAVADADKRAEPRPAAAPGLPEAAESMRRNDDAERAVADKALRPFGRKPCRKPSGERVDARIDDMEALPDFDKR